MLLLEEERVVAHALLSKVHSSQGSVSLDDNHPNVDAK